MQDYYEFNVSLLNTKTDRYEFFFRIQDTSIGTNKPQELYKILQEKFPHKEGYKIDITLWEGRGYHINRETFQKD